MSTTALPRPSHAATTYGPRHPWWGLAALALPILMVGIDVGAVFLALPALSADLGAGPVAQLWVVDVYGFALAAFLVTMGGLGDRVGRRRLLLIGASAFAVLSVAAAYAPTVEALIATRALLGVAGAALGPAAVGLIAELFPDHARRARAISVWAACQFGGAVLGPVVGGRLLEQFWWGSVFLLGLPVMLLLLAVGRRVLPAGAGSGRQSPARLDLVSVGLSLAAVVGLVQAVKAVSTGAPLAAVLLPALVGVTAAACFARRQLGLADPLLDLRAFGGTGAGPLLAAMLTGSAALAGVSFLATQYLQTQLGLGPADAGLWQAPTGLGIAAGVLAAPAVGRRLGPVPGIAAGLATGAAAYVLLAVAGQAVPAPVVVCLALAAAAFAAGPLFVLGTGAVLGSVAPERAGAAGSLTETSNELGSTLGIAVFGSVAAAGADGAGLGGGLPVAAVAAGVITAAAGAALLTRQAGTAR